ncbi:hypothetical protein IAQ61_000139 [Plenodomus lingam]|uniref:Protein prenyltransferase n=1 Tax=Leptosphaeria maculans (strain JN3 / isolate v23.1.3 / race Av1-4-5-6-7-8) TaxID=985895 RepID=E5R4G4_LEPMJ|nr:hypothetical protein LEMA_P046380.1 [Plenodomus lingam JN3]KAH9881414.1 hypothetical protein IAQ61_000139 [Plenodomus lingam]CBX91932.1 hypothetical protein LEMA_P046380.1 [Plenodomus lingam JN3]
MTKVDNEKPSRETLQVLAYERISDFFQKHADDVCEVEILPPAIQPRDGVSLQDGLNLGIPKKALALAYLEARRRFFDSKGYNDYTSMALQATKIMLLFDPEHLTAANYRKHWLNRLKAETGSQFGSAFHTALRQEQKFLNTILTSPLHRQTKSPTLWYHRLWVMNPLSTIELGNADDSQCVDFWRAELATVCKSGERHPKNYYAWQYARRLKPRMVSAREEDFIDVLKEWCCRNPSDISGWTFLLVLLSGSENAKKVYDTLRDVMIYTIKLQAEQESLWFFIRTVAVQYITQEEYMELCVLIQGQGTGAGSNEAAFMAPDQNFGISRWSRLMTQFLHLRGDLVYPS